MLKQISWSNNVDSIFFPALCNFYKLLAKLTLYYILMLHLEDFNVIPNISIAVRNLPIREALLPSTGSKAGRKLQEFMLQSLIHINADVDGHIKSEQRQLN